MNGLMKLKPECVAKLRELVPVKLSEAEAITSTSPKTPKYERTKQGVFSESTYYDIDAWARDNTTDYTVAISDYFWGVSLNKNGLLLEDLNNLLSECGEEVFVGPAMAVVCDMVINGSD